MTLTLYSEQAARWPDSGRHVLAHFDATTIVVYQAYCPEIADFAVANQRFGAGFSLSRMSWIKPNFLWMMYRSGWATKTGQERVLAVRLRRVFFDEVLGRAVPSHFARDRFPSRTAWQEAVRSSDVRLQWDPDHDPAGRPLPRRAVQLGLRGDILRRYAETEPVSIVDVTELASAQRENAHGDFAELVTPEEHVYLPADADVATAIGIDGGRAT